MESRARLRAAASVDGEQLEEVMMAPVGFTRFEHAHK